LNISVEAANLSDWRIESNRNFFARIGMLYANVGWLRGHVSVKGANVEYQL